MNQNKDPNHVDLALDQAAAALRWWRRAGVDFGVREEPRNQLAAVSPPDHDLGSTPLEPVDPQPRVQTLETTQHRVNAADASVLAASSHDLATLRSNMESFEGCSLKKMATQLVFDDGQPGSRVMLVGEAPGGDEDRIGRPFVGRAGQLLDRMLASIGLDRRQVYIANVVPWRPPGNRTPTPQETQQCLPFIKRQIQLADPEILVCLGASASQTLLGVREGITRARGKWVFYNCEDGRTIRALAMLHPAYLLRQPGQKRAAWADMRALANELRN